MNNINQLLTRRTEKVLPSPEDLKDVLKKRKISLYFGVDPTATKLHLGHTIGLRKLQEFANLGHHAILLFGTGTVLVGDPSLRAEARKPITQEEIEQNISTWKQQVSAILDFDSVTIKKNGDWLLKLTYKDIITIASHISAVQLFKRESFQRRIEKGNTVWYHETMYPLLQGYDSVAMDVDLEIGGTDQEFNMLIGRELQRKMNNREKFVLMTPMILGTDGKQMSKTSGNCVWLTDTAEDMFGKLMSIPDEQIVPYMELVTDISLSRVKEVKTALSSGKLHPLDAKKELALDVVTQFHGVAGAKGAKENFEKTIQRGEVPSDIPMFKISALKEGATIVDLLEQSQSVSSRGEAKRLIEQNAVSTNQLPITNVQFSMENLKQGDIIKAGKRKWIRLI